jgi:hypothetical protein
MPPRRKTHPHRSAAAALRSPGKARGSPSASSNCLGLKWSFLSWRKSRIAAEFESLLGRVSEQRDTHRLGRFEKGVAEVSPHARRSAISKDDVGFSGEDAENQSRVIKPRTPLTSPLVFDRHRLPPFQFFANSCDPKRSIVFEAD